MKICSQNFTSNISRERGKCVQVCYAFPEPQTRLSVGPPLAEQRVCTYTFKLQKRARIDFAFLKRTRSTFLRVVRSRTLPQTLRRGSAVTNVQTLINVLNLIPSLLRSFQPPDWGACQRSQASVREVRVSKFESSLPPLKSKQKELAEGDEGTAFGPLIPLGGSYSDTTLDIRHAVIQAYIASIV